MRKPINTKGQVVPLGSSGMVERQEAEGQKSFINSDTLPTSGLQREVKDVIEKAGGSIHKVVDSDPMFTYVTLPSGWEKRKSEHSMWSYLYDNKGKKVAAMFYKAAFYDREAFIRLDNDE